MAAALEVLATGVVEKKSTSNACFVMRQAKGRIIGGLKLVQTTQTADGRFA